MVQQKLLPTFVCAVLAVLAAAPLAAQQVQVQVPPGAHPTTVWKYSPACGAGKDYPDVPARPFLVGALGQTIVMWFAANSSGSFASVGVGSSPDILASLQRGTAQGPGCVSWLPAANYKNTAPAGYDGGYWMVAPFTPDGTHVQALVHNEFHGEWAGGTGWCWQQTTWIYLPCDYWNIISASSSDAASRFQLIKQPAPIDSNLPAIALGQPYTKPPKSPPPTNLPQGMTAQSNIVQVGGFYYVLAQQLPYQSPSQSGVCIYRAPIPPAAGTPLTWTGWDGSTYTVAVPRRYPSPDSMPLCRPVLGSQFRFSWSVNTAASQIIIVGQDFISNINTSGCAYAPNATAATVDQAFVYMTATFADGQLSTVTSETCLLQINSAANWRANPSRTGQAYPSLLDPTSPQLQAGDRNFMFSGQNPYLYFTQLNPHPGNTNDDRDLVRLPLTVAPRN